MYEPICLVFSQYNSILFNLLGSIILQSYTIKIEWIHQSIENRKTCSIKKLLQAFLDKYVEWLLKLNFPCYLRELRFLIIFTRKYLNHYFVPKKANFVYKKRAVIPRYFRFLNPWIVKTAHTKTENNKGRLHQILIGYNVFHL